MKWNELVKRRFRYRWRWALWLCISFLPLCHICSSVINSQAGFTLKNALLFWHELRPNVISREEAREFQIGCLAACGRRMWLCYLWQPIHRKSNANIRVTEQCTSQIPVYTTVGPCVNVQAVHRCVCVCVCDVAEHALSCRRPPPNRSAQ